MQYLYIFSIFDFNQIKRGMKKSQKSSNFPVQNVWALPKESKNGPYQNNQNTFSLSFHWDSSKNITEKFLLKNLNNPLICFQKIPSLSNTPAKKYICFVNNIRIMFIVNEPSKGSHVIKFAALTTHPDLTLIFIINLMSHDCKIKFFFWFLFMRINWLRKTWWLFWWVPLKCNAKIEI